jgi:hypothetical protein
MITSWARKWRHLCHMPHAVTHPGLWCVLHHSMLQSMPPWPYRSPYQTGR